MSFLLDPPLLVATGAAIERGLGDRPGPARHASRAAIAVFVGVSAGLYANAPGLERLWRPLGARSGRDFMLGSGLAHPAEPGHGVLALFALYPAWLALGRRLAAHATRARRAP
jgi:hypothetical protein